MYFMYCGQSGYFLNKPRIYEYLMWVNNSGCYRDVEVLVAVELVDATLIVISEFLFLTELILNIYNWALLLVYLTSYRHWDTDGGNIVIANEGMVIV